MKKIILIFTFIIIVLNSIWASENLYWSNSKTGPSTIEEAKRQFGNRTLNLIEGIWFGDSLGTVFIIKDSSESRFKLFIIDLAKDQYSNNLYNRTWEATFIYEKQSMIFFSRIWYHTGKQPYYRTQGGKAFTNNNELSLIYDSLSEHGLFMDNKMRRIWPMDINEYNLSFTSKEKKLDSSSIKEVKKYKNVNQDSRFSNINFRDIFNKILGF